MVLVSHYFPPHVGGIEYVVRNEARLLALSGHDVTVLTSAPDGVTAEDPESLGYQVRRVRCWNGMERKLGVPFPVFGPRLFLEAYKLVKSADIVHIHDCLYQTSWCAALLAKCLRKPLFITQHVQVVAHTSRLVELVQAAVFRAASWSILRQARRIFVLNSSVRRFLLRLGAKESRLVHLANGVDSGIYFPATSQSEKLDLRRELALPEDELLALFVGRPAPKKGIGLLLEAAGEDLSIVIAGGLVEQQHRSIGTTIELGEISPEVLSKVYRACDMFVLPSHAEGFPLTVQEAMASGLPVITTDDPGYDVYELDRRFIRLIPREVQAIRDALLEVSTDATLRALMSAYSVDCAGSKFGWDGHLATLLDHYAV